MCSLSEDAVIQRIVELLKKVGDQWEEEERMEQVCRAQAAAAFLVRAPSVPPALPCAV